MLRVVPWLLASVALAGCGGSAGPRTQTRTDLDAAGNAVTGEVRPPDARTPLVRAEGLWHCATDGRVELRISSEGLASLSLGDGLLASVSADRALINRSCTSRHPGALPSFRPRRVMTGDSHVRCAVPRLVLVDLRDGDLTVREPGRGRFLVGAAVSTDHLQVAGLWSTGCSLRR